MLNEYLIRHSAGRRWLLYTGQTREEYRRPLEIDEGAEEIVKDLQSGMNPDHIANRISAETGEDSRRILSDINELIAVLEK